MCRDIFESRWQVLNILDVDEANLARAVCDQKTFGLVKLYSAHVGDFLEVTVLAERWRHLTNLLQPV